MRMKKIIGVLILVLLLLVLPFLFSNQYLVQIINMIGIYALLGTGVNILTGYTGQLSLGQAAFYGIGAYTTGLLSIHFKLPFLVILPLAVIITAIFGIILAIPALKVKGSYLALVTIGFGEIVRMVLVNWVSFTKGPAGIVGIAPPRFFGYAIDTLHKNYYLILVFVAAGIIYQKCLMSSRTGRAFMAIREDDKAAELTGINITNFKIKAFVISAVYSAVAGVLYATMIRYISPDTFTTNDSNIILWTAIMGGMGTTAGPVIGAVVMTILPEALRFLGDWRMVIYGIMLLVVIIKYPGGLMPYLKKASVWIKKKVWWKGRGEVNGNIRSQEYN